jgi:hypothetical protein
MTTLLAKLPGNPAASIDEEISDYVRKELMRKVFHARVSVVVDAYRREAMGKDAKDGVSKVRFRTMLECWEAISKQNKAQHVAPTADLLVIFDNASDGHMASASAASDDDRLI